MRNQLQSTTTTDVAPRTARKADSPPNSAETRPGILRITHEPAEVARARAWIKARIAAAARPIDAETADDILICAGETITNAVVHSRPRVPGDTITVTMTVHPETVRVEVTDTGDPRGRGPHVRDIAPELESSGRGLRIVQELSAAWGHNGDGDSRTTWFEVGC
ncbi:ATP-binding protein [Actinomadura rugatobispora]|uniref:ATP-binding protein n=1 Tax=Actinomadura rugatobispora TaxID=1994 RepID=A0ABW1AII0_9ACTN|nr:ATP-binding protein [Actinomadura rugatobispora]